MAVVEIELLGMEFELDLPDGFTITGAMLLVKGESLDSETWFGGDSENLNWFERMGMAQAALNHEMDD